mmetsp:Transcript_21082/g.28027  ORF Transcript_21082/g.28027 Transcript_21082/m.28027 type:complete len:402 (+) Transcript_21082:28-1233(+)
MLVVVASRNAAAKRATSSTIALFSNKHHHHSQQRLFTSTTPVTNTTISNQNNDEKPISYYRSIGLECLSRRTPMKHHPIPAYNKRRRHVPLQNGSIPLPPYAKTGIIPPPSNSFIPFLMDQPIFHDENSIIKMRAAAQLARQMLDLACESAKPGITTDDIDILVHNELLERGAYPSPLNYHGFPKSLCSSVNEVICHGIPDGRALEVGDVVSFDVSCFYGGVHGDNCATVIVGDYDDDEQQQQPKTKFESKEQQDDFITARRLVQAAQESLNAAIEVCSKTNGQPRYLADVGNVIHDVVDSYGYGTVRKYRGHGICEVFHCAPYVKHYRNNDSLELKPGMIFTIEPMVTEFSDECYEWNDDWTVVTKDLGRAAQFEHTVLIKHDGVEILTVPPFSDDENDK